MSNSQNEHLFVNNGEDDAELAVTFAEQQLTNLI